MAETSKRWLAAFSELTGTSEVTNHNLARALRAAGLYTKPSKGSGHAKTSVNETELANFFLAQAAQHLNDAPEVVRQLRRLAKVGPQSSLGPGDLGETFDRLIGGVPPDSDLAPIIAKAAVPREIRLMTNPYRVDMVWYHHNKPPRGESYTLPQTSPFASYALQRVTFIYPALIELARQMLVEPEPETTNAALPGAALQIDQSAACTPDKLLPSRSDNKRRARVSASPPGYRRQKSCELLNA